MYGYSNANNATNCYTLKVALGTASRGPGISDVSNEVKISLYPNPAQQLLNVNVTAPGQVKVLTVYDISGKKIMTQQISQANAALNISKLANGIYLLQVNTPEGKELGQQKFIKQ